MKPDKQEGMTNNLELEKYCGFFGLPLVGVFSIDTLPDQLSNGFYICNTAPSYEAGQHWLCFGIDNGKCWYFDSLCLTMPEPIYTRLPKPIFHNLQKVQSDTSQYCGWICVIFGYYMYYLASIPCLQRRMEDIFKAFHLNPDENDKVIVKLVENAIARRERQLKV